MLALKKDKKNERSYKFGRWLLIVLALASIPLDGQKMYEEIQKSRMYLNKSMYDTVNFYSATMTIHFIGLSSAFEHEIWLTVFCRLLSAFIYQCELNSRTNETLPSDPNEMQKVLREKYPHKYPPNYGGSKASSKKRTTTRQSPTAKTKGKRTPSPNYRPKASKLNQKRPTIKTNKKNLRP